jgi:outer membrane protein
MASAQQLVKIGLVDSKRVYSEYRAVEKTRQTWNKMLKDYQDGLNARSREIEALKVELKEKGLLLTESERKNKERELEAKETSLRAFVSQEQDKLSKQNAELIRRLESDIQKAIKKIGLQEGYSLILDKSSSFYNAGGVDLTDKIISLLNGRGG